MTPLRVVDTGLADAAWNVALSAALAQLHQNAEIGDTLRLHRYRRSVLLGCHSLLSDVDAAACTRMDAQIVRRVSGGGAVAMEPGILAWDLVLTRTPSQTPADISAAICIHVANALQTFGANAGFRAPGDIVTGGLKIGGTAGFFDGLSMLHQGSLLLSPDMDDMAALLGRQTLPVTTLAIASRRVPEMPAVSAAVAAAIAAALGRAGRAGHLTPAETARARAMLIEEVRPCPDAC